MCRLSGALDRVHLDWDVNSVPGPSEAIYDASQQAVDTMEVDLLRSSPTLPCVNPVNDMISCMVQLDKLTTCDINYWSNPCSSGYFLCMRNPQPADSRPFRNAKQNIAYCSDADTSSSEDHTVGPGKWTKPHTKNIYYPSQGPSKARIAAHLSSQRKKELVAAEGLLSLQQVSSVNTKNDDTTSDNTDNGTSSSSGESESMHTLSSVSNRGGDIDDPTHSDNCSTCDDSTSSLLDMDEDNIPLAKIKQELAGQKSKALNTKENPSAATKRQATISKGKPYFKTKSFELFKWKRSRVFKCLGCEQTETSQQHINKHYHEEHGLLLCDICHKTCNTVSALRKHRYEHSDKANRFSCQDCNKSFPFKSQLKSHCKVHLSALEHHCLLCKKSYKNVGELTKHMNVHPSKTWKCQFKTVIMNAMIHATYMVICIVTKIICGTNVKSVVVASISINRSSVIILKIALERAKFLMFAIM